MSKKMYVDTYILLQILPFLTFDDRRCADYREGYDQAVNEIYGLIRSLEEESKDLERLKELCPIWDRLHRG